CHLEAQLLQDQIVRQVELQNGESYVSDEEFSDALTSPLSPQKDFLPESTFGDIVGDPAEALKQTTQKLIRNVGNQDFWRNTLRCDIRNGLLNELVLLHSMEGCENYPFLVCKPTSPGSTGYESSTVNVPRALVWGSHLNVAQQAAIVHSVFYSVLLKNGTEVP
ncbi:unnamed protein product, partial [Timema podura]|nr:unnamed protein product [Timema podura]